MLKAGEEFVILSPSPMAMPDADAPVPVSMLPMLLEGIDRLPDSGAIHRSGLWGTCDVREVAFDASRLNAGTNVLTLSLAAPGRPVNRALGFPGSAIMPDCLRLEVVDSKF